ncbi:MAG: efflux RND transporter periplasmic adaptor subunit [Pirellulales bacterium]|nr:efflux RND transporter periplasmic adaptor subunit [Pirellulales bacterium]
MKNEDEVKWQDEGGLRAPPELTGWRKAWWWFDFIILVKLARLRFIAILVVIGIVITQWDTLSAYYEKWTRSSDSASAASKDVEYFCPMHPSIIRDNSKEKCPICFMPLSKRKKGSGKPETLPAGVVNRVQLSPYRVVLAGVRTYDVGYLPLSKQINAVGFVEFDERSQRTVSARVAGRIDKLYVNQTGQMVKAGDDLALLYSPELFATAQTLIDAKQRGNQEFIENTRSRLKLLGIDDQQLGEILKSQKADSHQRIRSPVDGHVITKYVREGQYVEEGTPLYDVADLSKVWIQAQIYEDDLKFLPNNFQHGSPSTDASPLTVTATTRAFPNEPFTGTLAFVYPHVDEETRTVTVRFELANPEFKLRPGGTATVTLNVSPNDLPALQSDDQERARELAEGKVLAVPEGSVIDTGSQRIVYRQDTPGVYEGVLVSLGPRMTATEGGAFYPVLSGLNAGEKVVTSGSFLVDAETRLNPAAGSIYFGGSSGSKSSGSSVTTVVPSTPENPVDNVNSGLAKLSTEDRKLAEAQKWCPVLAGSALGSMGAPVKLEIEGVPVFICCNHCKQKALANPQETLKKVEELKRTGLKTNETAESTKEAIIEAELAKLPADVRALVEAQKFCAEAPTSRLGSMGPPLTIMVEGQPVFLCCEGCKEIALAKPKESLAKAIELRNATQTEIQERTAPKTNESADSTKEAEIEAELAKLPADVRALVEAQKYCAEAPTSRLGSMGPPLTIMVEGQPVFLCCEGCKEIALAKPKESLAKAIELRNATQKENQK